MAQTDNLTILFVDMVGFTQRTSLQSRSQNETMLRDFNRLLLPVIARFGGHWVKSLGDAMLVTFRSPTDGVRCGMALHDTLAEYNMSHAEPKQFHVRVALNVGEVRIERRDVFGEAVNVASRVESLTPQDEIYFTEAVYLAMNKAEISCESLGKHKLKGIPEPVRLFRVPPRQVHRLMPGGEDLGDAPGELPFGGMHRLPPEHGLAARMAARMAVVTGTLRQIPLQQWLGRLQPAAAPVGMLLLLAALFLVVPAYWAVRAPPAPDAKAASITADHRFESEAARLTAGQDALSRAQLAMQQGQRREAMQHYARALEIQPELKHNPLVVNQLVSTLGWASDSAADLIRTYPSPEMVDALSLRTAQRGPSGRRSAVALLRELKQSGRIDEAGIAIAELQEGASCEERLVAVKRLRQLRDPRALPPLRQSLGQGKGIADGITGWFQNMCLRDEAQATIKELEKLPARR